MVAVSYINNFGGRIENLHSLTKELWFWAQGKNLWLSAAHVPGVDNYEADKFSRNLHNDMEWKLKTNFFKEIENKFGKIEIDLFASRMSHQKDRYVSFYPDKHAMTVDAFTFNWNNYNNMYLFPPFSVLGRVIQKIAVDQVSRILLVAPIWPTQVWFTTLLHLIVDQSFILPTNCLELPSEINRKHPIKNLQLGVFLPSGMSSEIKAYQETLSPSYYSLGESQPANNMGHISKDGCVFQIKKMLIPLIHLSNQC